MQSNFSVSHHKHSKTPVNITMPIDPSNKEFGFPLSKVSDSSFMNGENKL